MAKINLNKVFESAIHGPKSDGFVLYGKVPEYKASTQLEKNEAASEKFLKASESTFNSPNNIRTVLMTNSQVAVRYYLTYVVKGKAHGSTWAVRKFSGIGLRGIAEESIMNEVNKTQTAMQQALRGGSLTQLTGNVFGIFSSPWVCSNIEEIYFDYTVIASERIKNSGVPEILDIMKAIASGGNARLIESPVFLKMFMDDNSIGDLGKLREKFPRLRAIGLVSNLDALIANDKMLLTDKATDAAEAKKLWLQKVPIQSIPGNVVVVCDVAKTLVNYEKENPGKISKSVLDSLTYFNDTFVVRDGIYKFDRLYLNKFKERMTESKKSTAIGGLGGGEKETSNSGKSTDNTEKTEEELFLDSEVTEGGDGLATRVLRISMAGLGKSDIHSLFGSMSSSGLKKYARLAGITSDIEKHSDGSRFTERLKSIDGLIRLPVDVKSNILTKLGILADELVLGEKSKVIEDNKEVFNTLCRREVLYTMYYDKQEMYSKNLLSSNRKLASFLANPASIEGFIKQLAPLLGSEISKPSLITGEEVEAALKQFGVKKADTIDDSVLDVFDPEDGLDDFEFDDDDLELDPGEPEIYDDDTEKSDDESSDELGEAESSEPDEDKLEGIKETWREKANFAVGNIMDSYKQLYKSGYGLIIPAGVLTNVGTVKTNSSAKLVYGGSRVLDIEIYNALNNALGSRSPFGLYSDGEPDINVLLKSPKPIVYTKMHIGNLFGYYDFCGASLKKHIASIYGDGGSFETAKDSGKLPSKSKVIKYEDIEGWIRERLLGYFYKAYMDVGVTTDIDNENISKVNMVNERLSSSLKNAIIVAERKDGVNTRIRICTDTPLNPDSIVNSLKSQLNIGTSDSIKVNQIGAYENGVLDVNIIYNDKAYSQDSLFAYQVLDNLEEQGIRPSWDNVVLGKKDDGTIMTYNFKSTKNPIYALYAGSRAGKGVMTLNLLCSAATDNCDIFYLDAKPDMAITLTDVAWGKGLDCFAFNGLQGAKRNLELDNPKCPRQISPFCDIGNIPKGIFSSKENLEKFAELTTYIRGLELMCKIANERTGNKPDRWLVVVFDEVKQVSNAQRNIVKSLDDAYDARKKEPGPDGKKINEFQDEVCNFIRAYKKWLRDISEAFVTCVSSTFGFANMTVFFVWQETDFPDQYRGSILADAVLAAQAKMVKIMGARAARKNGSTTFGTPSSLSNATWYDNRFTDEKKGGYFAIGSDVNSDASMTVFRPFNVFSNANDKARILENAAISGLTEKDLIGVSLDSSGNVIKEIGFEGYADKLLSRFGLDTATQLNHGYVYADDSVRQLGLGPDLLTFMYDCHSFGQNNDDMGDIAGESGGAFSEGLNPDAIGFEDDSGSGFISFDDEPQGSGSSGFAGSETPNITRDGSLGMVDSLSDYMGALNQVASETVDSGVNVFGDHFGSGEKGNVFDFEDDDDEVIDFGNFSIDDGDEESNNVDFGEADAFGSDSGFGEGEFEESINQGEVGEYEASEPTGGNDDVEVSFSDLFEDGYFQPEEMPSSDERTAERTGKTGRIFRIKPERTSNAWELNNDNCILAVMPPYDTAERFNNRLFRTIKGANWEFDRRWQTVLKCIKARVRSVDLIKRVRITADSLVINGRYVAMQGVLGGFEDIQLRDIVNLQTMAKKFKNIEELSVDREIYNKVCMDCNWEDPVAYIFGILPHLMVLRLIGLGSNKKGESSDILIDRQGYRSVQDKKAAEKLKQEEMYREQIKAMAGTKDPRFGERSVSDQAKTFDSAKSFGGNIRQTAQSQFRKSSGSFLRGTAFSVFTIGAIVVGGTAGAIAGAWHWLNNSSKRSGKSTRKKR